MDSQQASDLVHASEVAAQYSADAASSTRDLLAYAAVQAFEARALLAVLIVGLLVVIALMVRRYV